MLMKRISLLCLLCAASLAAPALTPDARAQPRPGRAWLGVLLGQDSTPGILIRKVYPGSPAQAAGFKVNDRVFRVAGGGVFSIPAMQQAIAAYRPGQTIRVKIKRAGHWKVLTVHLKAMPTYEQRVRKHLLNKPAPALNVTRVSNGRGGPVITNRTLKGHVVLLEFWASWCSACRSAVPMLKMIHKQYAPRGLKMVAIAKDSVQRIAPLARALRLPYTVGADPLGSAMRAFWINPIPAFVLLDSKGVVRAIAIGAGWGPSFRNLLKTAHRLLTQHPAASRAPATTGGKLPAPRRRARPRRHAPGYF